MNFNIVSKTSNSKLSHILYYSIRRYLDNIGTMLKANVKIKCSSKIGYLVTFV